MIDFSVISVLGEHGCLVWTMRGIDSWCKNVTSVCVRFLVQSWVTSTLITLDISGVILELRVR